MIGFPMWLSPPWSPEPRAVGLSPTMEFQEELGSP